MKLLGSTKCRIAKHKNGENVPHLSSIPHWSSTSPM